MRRGRRASAASRVLVDGANLDDLGDDRPGMRATAEAGVVHPLLRPASARPRSARLARALGLPTWDAPQQACLASRIPYGEPITVAKLAAVADAERALRELGFRQCRVTAPRGRRAHRGRARRSRARRGRAREAIAAACAPSASPT